MRLISDVNVQAGDNGVEHRVIRTAVVRRSWTMDFQHQFVDDVEDLYETQQGPWRSFLFRPPRERDYRATDQVIGTGNGTTTDFQLVVKKTNGTYTVTRNILHPRAGLITVYLNGVSTMLWTLQPLGIIRFNSAPTASTAVISADFNYDTPVRFQSDELETALLMSSYNPDTAGYEIVTMTRRITVVEVFSE